MSESNGWLRAQAERLGVSLSSTALDQLSHYSRLLQEWNERINLTRITGLQEIYELHFLDSLSVALAVEMASVESVIDVGTGAGFPGLVLAIAFPNTQVVLLDSINKKTRFLQMAVNELGLAKQVGVVCERAEVVGHDPHFREQYDLVVARAVARLATLAEYCMPLVRVGGCFVAQKGPEMAEELAEAGPGLALLGGDRGKTCEWRLPSGAARTLVRVDKYSSTPSKFPRRPGLAEKRPLL